MCPTSTAWSACPTRRTGCITTRRNASTNCLSTSSPPCNRHAGRARVHRPTDPGSPRVSRALLSPGVVEVVEHQPGARAARAVEVQRKEGNRGRALRSLELQLVNRPSPGIAERRARDELSVRRDLLTQGVVALDDGVKAARLT